MPPLSSSRSAGAEGRTLKLTGPQRSLLKELAGSPRYVSASYPPIVKLLDMGLITAKAGKWSETYHLTDAGREALALAEGRPASSGDAP